MIFRHDDALRRALSRGLFYVMSPSTSTPSARPYVAKRTERDRNWVVVDANGKTLGRMATQIADALRGKRKPEYTPHIDTGDFVVVINAEKVAVTGNKRADKRYYRHSGYPGGLRSRTFEEMLARRPEEIIRLAVKGTAAAHPARQKTADEAEDLRRARAPARGPETATFGDRGLMADEDDTQETPAEGEHAVPSDDAAEIAGSAEDAALEALQESKEHPPGRVRAVRAGAVRAGPRQRRPQRGRDRDRWLGRGRAARGRAGARRGGAGRGPRGGGRRGADRGGRSRGGCRGDRRRGCG